MFLLFQHLVVFGYVVKDGSQLVEDTEYCKDLTFVCNQ